MSKYSPLSDFLAQRAEDDWRASFAEVEMVLGASLPKSARQSSSARWARKSERGLYLLMGETSSLDAT